LQKQFFKVLTTTSHTAINRAAASRGPCNERSAGASKALEDLLVVHVRTRSRRPVEQAAGPNEFPIRTELFQHGAKRVGGLRLKIAKASRKAAACHA
jgi:hypothetical protein